MRLPFLFVSALLAIIEPTRFLWPAPPTPVLQRIIETELTIRQVGPCAVPSTVGFVARAVDGLSGVEYAPQPCEWDRGTPTPAVPIEPLALQGRTVEQALNELFRLDSRYRWVESDGVIIARPSSAWSDASHFLHRVHSAFSFEERNLHGALDSVRRLFGEREPPVPTVLEGRTEQAARKFTLNPQTLSGLDILNAVVRAHGAMQWEIKYCKPSARPENARITLTTTDKAAGSVEHQSCRMPL